MIFKIELTVTKRYQHAYLKELFFLFDFEKLMKTNDKNESKTKPNNSINIINHIIKTETNRVCSIRRQQHCV